MIDASAVYPSAVLIERPCCTDVADVTEAQICAGIPVPRVAGLVSIVFSAPSSSA